MSPCRSGGPWGHPDSGQSNADMDICSRSCGSLFVTPASNLRAKVLVGFFPSCVLVGCLLSFLKTTRAPGVKYACDKGGITPVLRMARPGPGAVWLLVQGHEMWLLPQNEGSRLQGLPLKVIRSQRKGHHRLALHVLFQVHRCSLQTGLRQSPETPSFLGSDPRGRKQAQRG